MLDLTMGELDAFAKGHDRARRAEVANTLWAARETAFFVGYVWAGKRLPSIKKRIRQIMTGEPERPGDVSAVIAGMQAIAIRAGLPPPKKRMN